MSEPAINPPEWDMAAELDHVKRQLAELQEPCLWTKTKDGCWRASCNRSRWKVKFHGMKFCPFCGHPIQEHREGSDE